MEVIECPSSAFETVLKWRMAGFSVGLVPTMGALHQGHLSLVERAVAECDRSVATVFVNPTQFGPNEDFSRYPRTLKKDLEYLRSLNIDAVFVPSNESLYPIGYSTFVEPPEVAWPLEGVFRPGHFRGVATVVLKLFQILPATVAYFGQKDYQQLAVIRRMTQDLNVPIQIQGCPTVREPDGLALSSRNRYLNHSDRMTATGLWQALQAVKGLFDSGERAVKQLNRAMAVVLEQHGIHGVDYARVVDAHSLSEIETVKTSAVALIAARVGQTRLIDNMSLDP